MRVSSRVSKTSYIPLPLKDIQLIMPTKTTNELIGNKVWADITYKFRRYRYHLKAIILRAWVADSYARSLRNRCHLALDNK